MAKATHSGTCQICGNFQKLPNGLLSTHGYTVQWGFFSGTCRGSKGLPFEQSTDLIEKMIENCKTEIVNLNTEIVELRACVGDKAWVHPHYGFGEAGYGSQSGHRWERCKLTETVEENIGPDKVTRHSFSYDRELNPEKQRKFDHNPHFHGYPKSMAEAVKDLNEQYIQASLERRIEELNRYIAWQAKRVAEWKPAELTPVK